MNDITTRTQFQAFCEEQGRIYGADIAIRCNYTFLKLKEEGALDTAAVREVVRIVNSGFAFADLRMPKSMED